MLATYYYEEEDFETTGCRSVTNQDQVQVRPTQKKKTKKNNTNLTLTVVGLLSKTNKTVVLCVTNLAFCCCLGLL